MDAQDVFAVFGHPVWGPLLIFTARIIDVSLDTMRVLFIMRGKRGEERGPASPLIARQRAASAWASTANSSAMTAAGGARIVRTAIPRRELRRTRARLTDRHVTDSRR